MARLPWLVRHVRIGLMPTSSYHCVQVTSRSVLCPWQRMLTTCPGFISSVSSGRQSVQSPQSVPLGSVCAWTQAHEKASLPVRRSAGSRYVNASDGPETRFWTLSNLSVGGTQGLTLLPPKYREPSITKDCAYLGEVTFYFWKFVFTCMLSAGLHTVLRSIWGRNELCAVAEHVWQLLEHSFRVFSVTSVLWPGHGRSRVYF